MKNTKIKKNIVKNIKRALPEEFCELEINFIEAGENRNDLCIEVFYGKNKLYFIEKSGEHVAIIDILEDEINKTITLARVGNIVFDMFDIQGDIQLVSGDKKNAIEWLKDFNKTEENNGKYQNQKK